jgi:hypothetical protein
MGDTANEKKAVISYKNHKQVKHQMSDWVIVNDTHSAIISRKDWQICFDMIKHLGRVRRTKESEMLPFTGLLICQDCGYTMRHNHSYYKTKSGEKMRHNCYNCSTYSTTGKAECVSHYIPEKDLMKIVCNDIRRKAESIVFDEDAARKHFFEQKTNADNIDKKSDEQMLKRAQKRILEIDKLMQKAFEQSVLSNTNFFPDLIQKYESEKLELTEKIRQVTEIRERESKSESDVETFIDLMKDCVDITTLDRATAVQLIDKIIIPAKNKNPREIVICYNFVGLY